MPSIIEVDFEPKISIQANWHVSCHEKPKLNNHTAYERWQLNDN